MRPAICVFTGRNLSFSSLFVTSSCRPNTFTKSHWTIIVLLEYGLIFPFTTGFMKPVFKIKPLLDLWQIFLQPKKASKNFLSTSIPSLMKWSEAKCREVLPFATRQILLQVFSNSSAKALTVLHVPTTSTYHVLFDNLEIYYAVFKLSVSAYLSKMAFKKHWFLRMSFALICMFYHLVLSAYKRAWAFLFWIVKQGHNVLKVLNSPAPILHNRKTQDKTDIPM